MNICNNSFEYALESDVSNGKFHSQLGYTWHVILQVFLYSPNLGYNNKSNWWPDWIENKIDKFKILNIFLSNDHHLSDFLLLNHLNSHQLSRYSLGILHWLSVNKLTFENVFSFRSHWKHTKIHQIITNYFRSIGRHHKHT